MDLGAIFVNLGANLLEQIPVVGKALSKIFQIASPLTNALFSAAPELFNNDDSAQDEKFDPYIVRVKTRRRLKRLDVL